MGMCRDRAGWARPLGAALGLLALGMVGCELEDRPRNLIQEVRVAAVKLEPAEVIFPDDALSDPVALANLVKMTGRALVVDPANPGATLDVSVVACTDLGGACIEQLQYEILGGSYTDADEELTEAAWRDWLTYHAWRGTVTLDGLSGEVDFALSTFEGWPWYLSYLEQLAGQPLLEYDPRVAILVCHQGQCPVFGELDAYLADPAAQGGAEVFAQLSLSQRAADIQPMEAYSFGTKRYRVSRVEGRPPNHNPTVADIRVNGEIVEPGTLLELSSTQQIVVSPSVRSYEEVYGESGLLGYEALTVSLLTSSGAVAPYVQQASFNTDGVEVTWDVPEQGEAYLWATLRDARGGLGWAELRGRR